MSQSMKKFGKYFVLLAFALVIVGAILTTTSVAAKGVALPEKTTVVSNALTPRTMQLFTNQVINQGQTLNSNFINVQGYKTGALYVSEVNAPTYLQISGLFSIDGTTGYYSYGQSSTLGEMTLGGQPVGQKISFLSTGGIYGPMFRLSVLNGTDPSYPPSATFSATLYLMP